MHDGKIACTCTQQSIGEQITTTCRSRFHCGDPRPVAQVAPHLHTCDTAPPAPCTSHESVCVALIGHAVSQGPKSLANGYARWTARKVVRVIFSGEGYPESLLLLLHPLLFSPATAVGSLIAGVWS